jgi:hypothetical protein
MTAILQDVQIRWTKASRAGERASQRNRVPRVYPVPGVSPTGSGLQVVHHGIVADEADGFRPVHEVVVEAWPDGRMHRVPGLALRISAIAITGTFAWEFSCGAPERSREPRQVLAVRPGTWGRATWNGRYTTMQGLDQWKYHERVLNIALFEELPADPFAGEPAKLFESLADLR